MKQIFIAVPLFFFLSVSLAQIKDAEELIADSQTGGTKTYFYSNSNTSEQLKVSDFKNSFESTIRNGLPYFLSKTKSSKRLKIAYLGGSITRAPNQYRLQSFKYIQSLYPNVNLIGINAGISGTDADLGACRLYDQVLKYKPDLIFIEFAVNGGYPQGVEGIIRQIIKENPEIGICLLYSVTTKSFLAYQNHKVPQVIQELEKVAEHYNIPSIHMGMEAAELVGNGKLIPIGKPGQKDVAVFSGDGVHPLPAGGDLYAASIARFFNKIKHLEPNQAPSQLIKPLYVNNLENATMVDLKNIEFSKGWEALIPANNLGTYKNWFPYVMTSEQSDDSFSFKYKGSAFGVFDIGAPETGQMDVYLDGKKVKINALSGKRLYNVNFENPEPIARFNKYCNNRTRGQYFLIETPGDNIHTVTFKISKEKLNKKEILGPTQQEDITKNPEKYNHNRIYIGKILLNGTLIK